MIALLAGSFVNSARWRISSARLDQCSGIVIKEASGMAQIGYTLFSNSIYNPDRKAAFRISTADFLKYFLIRCPENADNSAGYRSKHSEDKVQSLIGARLDRLEVIIG
jgi:hypothetical protein